MFSSLFKRPAPQKQPLFAPGTLQLSEKVHWLARKGLIDGSVHAFQGPIKDQSGKVRVKAGEHANDGLLAGMNFYVEGIDAKFPGK